MNKPKQAVTVRPNPERMSEVVKLCRKHVRSLGRRPLTGDDFHTLCKQQGVFVINERSEREFMEQVGGLYLNIVGVPTIILNAYARGLRREWTMFHELGHHLLHADRLTALCFGDDEDKYEVAQYEADAFAGICLIPKLSESLARKLERRIDLFRHFKL